MDEGTDEERDIYAGDKYPGYFKTWHRHRKQLYDRRAQYVSYAHNHLKGHKLPMLAKFPRISDFFEIIPPEHSWSNHHPGIFNGIFIVPDTQPHHFSIPDITINGKDYTASFFGSFPRGLQPCIQKIVNMSRWWCFKKCRDYGRGLQSTSNGDQV